MPRPKKSGYPERLLIYHSGVGKTVFLGCMKITTLFLFAFSALVIVPRFYYSPDEPNWAAAAALVGGVFPLLFVAYTTAPFVHYVHVRLPVFARQSQEQLIRWSKNIAPSTEIDLTTMRLYGLPRVTRVLLSNLREKDRSLLSVANLVKVPSRFSGPTKRPWWMGRAMTRFYVSKEQPKNRDLAIWPKVLESIRKSKTPNAAKAR
ncbi:hypothetical protein MMC30_002430 [Trapelia coarctata]|nr:hypothetical protein [Trapelia coarctata]